MSAGHGRTALRQVAQRPVTVVAVVVGLNLVGVGAWALADPASFYRSVATYPPYNEHLLHDIGAFEVGLGVALLVGAAARGPLLAALVGNAVGAVLHAVAHVVDRDLGGSSRDPWTMSALAALLVALVVVALRGERTRGTPPAVELDMERTQA